MRCAFSTCRRANASLAGFPNIATRTCSSPPIPNTTGNWPAPRRLPSPSPRPLEERPMSTAMILPSDLEPRTKKPNLLTVEDAKALDIKKINELFVAHMNPGQLHFMKLLGFHKVKIERAEGMYYFDQNGRKILDFFGGFGSLAFGHNHPRILAARRTFAEEKRQEIAIAFISQYATALAANLAACSPGDLDMVF